MTNKNYATLEDRAETLDINLEVLNLRKVLSPIMVRDPKRALMDASFDPRFKEYYRGLVKRIGEAEAKRFARTVMIYGGFHKYSTVLEYMTELNGKRF